MMSSQHIRETKIKHASPPSAGWLLSLGLKTVVTHEHSSQTKTCTLCKSQRDSAYSKHTGVQCLHVHSVCVFGLFAPKLCLAPWHTDAFSGSCDYSWHSFHLLYASSGPWVTFSITLQVLKPRSSPLQPKNHCRSQQSGGLQFKFDQLALRRRRTRPLGKDLIKLINPRGYYLQIGCLASKQICK